MTATRLIAECRGATLTLSPKDDGYAVVGSSPLPSGEGIMKKGGSVSGAALCSVMREGQWTVGCSMSVPSDTGVIGTETEGPELGKLFSSRFGVTPFSSRSLIS